MDGTCMYNCPTFFLFWKCLADMSYWTNLNLTVADNELHFFTISNLNYTVFVSLAHIRIARSFDYCISFIFSSKHLSSIQFSSVASPNFWWLFLTRWHYYVPRQTRSVQVVRNGHEKLHGRKAPLNRHLGVVPRLKSRKSFIKCTEPINTTAKAARVERVMERTTRAPVWTLTSVLTRWRYCISEAKWS